jgi:hypothetical protein
MSISVTDLRDYIMIPTLRWMEPEVPYSKPAVQLLLGTGAKESELGFWLDQTTQGPGPAYGIYQMEEATYYDHIRWMTTVNRPLLEKFLDLAGSKGSFKGAARMRGDLALATFMARVHYYRVAAGMPVTLSAQAAYWKRYYNTFAGAGTEAQYIAAYNRLIGAAGNLI